MKKKKIMTFVLALVMVVTMPGVVSVKAATATTPVISSQCAYTLYVRKNENTDVLGKMRMTRSIESDGKTVSCSNKFTADTDCKKVTVYASYKDGDYTTNTESGVSANKSVIATKFHTYKTAAEASASKTYGKCSVTYN